MTTRILAKPRPKVTPPAAKDLRRWAILDKLAAPNYGAAVGEQIDNLRATDDPWLHHVADLSEGLLHVCATGTVRQMDAYINGMGVTP